LFRQVNFADCTCSKLSVCRILTKIGSQHLSSARVDPPLLTIATDRPQTYSAIDTLRSFAVVLVVAHHAILAYALIAPTVTPRSPLPWLTGIPVVDGHRLLFFDVWALLDDTWLMALMFLLSGLFVGPSLARKGGRNFLRDRALRLGLPFLVISLLMPLAYYPAYRLTAADPTVLGFWREWLSVGTWPSGPLWFIGVLLEFDVIVVLLYRYAPAVLQRAGELASHGRQRPAAVFAALLLASAATHVPMLILFGPDNWALVGLIPVQGSRVLHQLAYFLVGVAIGSCGIGRGLLAPDGRLAQHWLRWNLAALGLFAVNVVLYARLALPQPADAPLAAQLTCGLGFVVCCAAISFAMLATFVRFVNFSTPVLDSLNGNSYGIYLIHYGFVMWMQFALLTAPMPTVAKAAVVLVVSVAASWAVTAALRRIPAVAKVV
jgi:surface polysaccharide O-acyltransferase-like enzyme